MYCRRARTTSLGEKARGSPGSATVGARRLSDVWDQTFIVESRQLVQGCVVYRATEPGLGCHVLRKLSPLTRISTDYGVFFAGKRGSMRLRRSRLEISIRCRPCVYSATRWCNLREIFGRRRVRRKDSSTSKSLLGGFNAGQKPPGHDWIETTKGNRQGHRPSVTQGPASLRSSGSR